MGVRREKVSCYCLSIKVHKGQEKDDGPNDTALAHNTNVM